MGNVLRRYSFIKRSTLTIDDKVRFGERSAVQEMKMKSDKSAKNGESTLQLN